MPPGKVPRDGKTPLQAALSNHRPVGGGLRPPHAVLGAGMTWGTNVLDHPSVRAVRGSPPLALRSDGNPVLPVPGPPASAAEWTVRRLALAGILPSLAPAVPDVPAGWIGVLEIAAHALHSQGLARGLSFLRLDARGSALTLWPDTDEADPTPRAVAVQAICEWAESRSGDTCMAHGTPSAGMTILCGRRVTLGPHARTLPVAELRRLIWPGRHDGRAGTPKGSGV